MYFNNFISYFVPLHSREHKQRSNHKQLYASCQHLTVCCHSNVVTKRHNICWTKSKRQNSYSSTIVKNFSMGLFNASSYKYTHLYIVFIITVRLLKKRIGLSNSQQLAVALKNRFTYSYLSKICCQSGSLTWNKEKSIYKQTTTRDNVRRMAKFHCYKNKKRINLTEV